MEPSSQVTLLLGRRPGSAIWRSLSLFTLYSSGSAQIEDKGLITPLLYVGRASDQSLEVGQGGALRGCCSAQMEQAPVSPNFPETLRHDSRSLPSSPHPST